MENNSRSLFGIDGITGMLIATVLLLGILGGLTALGIVAQQSNATNYYKIENAKGMQFNSTANASHKVDAK
jgi:hypothetical protein